MEVKTGLALMAELAECRRLGAEARADEAERYRRWREYADRTVNDDEASLRWIERAFPCARGREPLPDPEDGRLLRGLVSRIERITGPCGQLRYMDSAALRAELRDAESGRGIGCEIQDVPDSSRFESGQIGHDSAPDSQPIGLVALRVCGGCGDEFSTPTRGRGRPRQYCLTCRPRRASATGKVARHGC